jgi:hypothetical protein
MAIFTNPVIYGGLCFLLGVLFTAFIVHILTKDRERQSRKMMTFNEATSRFRRIIAEEIAERANSDPRKADLSRLANIQAAIIEFKPHLSHAQQEKIEETWNKYKTHESNRAAQLSMAGYNSGASIKRELLEELLKFTK